MAPARRPEELTHLGLGLPLALPGFGCSVPDDPGVLSRDCSGQRAHGLRSWQGLTSGLRPGCDCRSELTLTQAHVGELTLSLSLSVSLSRSLSISDHPPLTSYLLPPPALALRPHAYTYIYNVGEVARGNSALDEYIYIYMYIYM